MGPWSFVRGAGVAIAVAAASLLSTGHAFGATPSVTIPAGPFSNGQAITVTGSGFPPRADDPSGLQILECSDTGGLASNLPTDPSTCDGATTNPLPVDTDASGRFTVQYDLQALTGLHGTSNIACDASDYCVLWVGVDYNEAFTSGPHAFSRAFEVATAAISGGTTPSPAGVGAAATTTEAGQPAGSPAAATGSSSSTAGTLASTGPPAELPWLVAAGLALALTGAIGRRAATRRVR